MKLGEVEISNGDGDVFGLSWKRLLPFLNRVGGAVYLVDSGDETEVWLYLD